ncbi:helix-turn-helix domain-containing protein [Halorubrum trueperi]|uniref:Helix-turn-helix domain-containing protein n=1 Tax=Halorubrum trueperi TaxID=2004704 RepID=A0ABD5UJ21_9EURY
MNLFVDFEFTPTDSVLESIAESNSELVIRVPLLLTLERSIVCYSVFIGDGAEESVDSLRKEDTITSIRIVDRPANALLVSLELPLRTGSLLGNIANLRVEIVEAVKTSETWLFRLRCPNYEILHEFVERCERNDHGVHVERVYESASDQGLLNAVLTPQQEVALRVACDAGYFCVPRESSLKELSDELDVSDSAVSQRLRRGTNALLSMLFDGT